MVGRGVEWVCPAGHMCEDVLRCTCAICIITACKLHYKRSVETAYVLIGTHVNMYMRIHPHMHTCTHSGRGRLCFQGGPVCPEAVLRD